MNPEFGIVILAAGNSSRMGQPKQLMDYGGQPLVRHAARVALDAGCGPVVVVAGAVVEPVAEALAGLPVMVATNSRWAEGMGTSIQAGLAALPKSSAGAILTLADLPMITAEHYRRLVALHLETGRDVVAAEYAGTVGVPVLFSRERFPLLEALPPEQGCKGVILRSQPSAWRMPCPEAEADVDTLEDYRRLVTF